MQATTVGRTKAIEVREITIFLNKTDFISKRIFAPKNPNNRDKKTEKNDWTKVNFIISKIPTMSKRTRDLLKIISLAINENDRNNFKFKLALKLELCKFQVLKSGKSYWDRVLSL